MNKEEFKNLKFEDKVAYLNAKLGEGQTVTRIREDIGIGEKTLQKEIKLNGYRYDNKLKQYIPNTGSNTTSNTGSNTYSNTTSNTDENNVMVLKENSNQILKESQQAAINFLEQNLEIFQMVVEKFKTNTESNTNSNTDKKHIVIDLIDDKHLKPQAKAFRVNMFVYEEWQKFCGTQRHSKQDLLSMAMKEYIEKYS